jgi:D-3-phosphoglycerate dehydrogenase
MKKKLNILSTVDLSMVREDLIKLKKKSNFIYTNGSLEKIKKIINIAEMYISSAKIKIDKEFLKNAKNLKFIFSPSTGTDHIDLNELKKRKIKCFHIAKERKLLNSFTATSELVFALILMLNRSLIINHQQIINNSWTRDKFPGIQLFNKTLGIIGLGRLGKITSKIGQGFGMKVIGYDTNKKIRLNNVKNVGLSFLLKNSDIVSIHIHLTEKTTNFLNKKKLVLMKKNSTLINTSRGKIINEKDLLFFLKARKNFKVGLDVIDGEWLDKNKLKKHALINYSKKNNNLIILPHIGGSTIESIYGARLRIVKKILYKLN